VAVSVRVPDRAIRQTRRMAWPRIRTSRILRPASR